MIDRNADTSVYVRVHDPRAVGRRARSRARRRERFARAKREQL